MHFICLVFVSSEYNTQCINMKGSGGNLKVQIKIGNTITKSRLRTNHLKKKNICVFSPF